MHSSRSSVRLLGVGVVLAGVLTLGALLVPGGGPTAQDPAGTTPASGPVAVQPEDPLTVLRAWDRARAGAWATGDREALRRLYVAGSPAGRSDRRLLAAYLARGLRVEQLRMQVDSVEVETLAEDRIALLVTDRLAGAKVTGRRGEVPLPQDGWSQRRVVLVRAGQRWRVLEVTGHESPAATTEATSGSENS